MYRIVKCVEPNETYFKIQKRTFFMFWKDLEIRAVTTSEAGTVDELKKFRSLEEAREAVKQLKASRPRKVVCEYIK